MCLFQCNLHVCTIINDEKRISKKFRGWREGGFTPLEPSVPIRHIQELTFRQAYYDKQCVYWGKESDHYTIILFTKSLDQ